MPSTILVPVDGSDKDARALAVAADLAQLADASVLVVRVRNPQAADTESRANVARRAAESGANLTMLGENGAAASTTGARSGATLGAGSGRRGGAGADWHALPTHRRPADARFIHARAGMTAIVR